MSNLSPEQLQAKTPEDRAEYLFELLLREGKCWALEGPMGWVMLSAQGDACTPLFPDTESATAWAAQQYPEAKPKTVSLDELQKRWFPLWQEDEVMIMLFPLANEEEGVVAHIRELIEAIAEEQAK
ncbi:DUF2750 domain-containing protein [Aliiglaciecola sp. CAU 1673]|uniref:DUF2750 domain-containing protein n=1 Tax=Aliiglaciecola sp. CAU 1673 TaxID=3032595 RepID=UPI0023D9EAEE|nr:DUF2750 domain-containing protein [Aliiglaciecola sp. CAU 1673]MDF2177084.1 DUF2750 domain-containing protein [Aliiglaciecola sp. CAU 1673]